MQPDILQPGPGPHVEPEMVDGAQMSFRVAARKHPGAVCPARQVLKDADRHRRQLDCPRAGLRVGQMDLTGIQVDILSQQKCIWLENPIGEVERCCKNRMLQKLYEPRRTLDNQSVIT